MSRFLKSLAPADARVRRIGLATMSIALVLLLLAPRWISVFTESINWDEFTMLERTDRTVRHGEVIGGGRPGLVTLLLTPFVRNCTDVITTAVHARLFWQVITLAYLVGVLFVVRNWFRFSKRPENGLFEGLVAVALLAFLPSFVAWSVQVRSDQAALAAAIWGGTALLSDRRLLSAVAGCLFGLALLCSQKALYLIALCGLLWIAAIPARLEGDDSLQWKAELLLRSWQTVVTAIFIGATLVAYGLLVPKAAGLVDGRTVISAWDQMRVVRELLGFRTYFGELSHVPLHVFLFLALVLVSVKALYRREHWHRYLLGTCWAVLLLGVAVVILHGSGYPYFLMTAGLFPAVALGLASGPLLRTLIRGRTTIVVLCAFTLILGSVPITIELLNGRQVDQRDTIQWINSSGLGVNHGYQVDGALICMADHDQIEPLSHTLNMRSLYTHSVIDQLVDEFLADFRERPVSYVLDVDRLTQFPKAAQEFWADHYLWYFGSVWVAGFEFTQATADRSIDVIVPGKYRWVPTGRNTAAKLYISGQELLPRERIELQAGSHKLSISPTDARGVLVMDLASAPGTDPRPFIDPQQLRRLYSLP